MTSPSRAETVRQSWRRLVTFVPELRQPGLVALVGALIVLGTVAALVVGSRAPRRAPYAAVLVQGALGLWAAGWFAGFWRQRAAYRQRYGADAYRFLFFRFLLPGLVGGLAVLWLPLFVGGTPLLPPAVAYGAAAYLLLSATLLERRGPEIYWSWDIRAFVYSVFPERGPVLTSGVFRWLRHPVYSAFVRTVLGFALLRNNLPALLCAALLVPGIWLLGRTEERDLMQSHPGYGAYRARVPPWFSTRPIRFWRFLLTGR